MKNIVFAIIVFSSWASLACALPDKHMQEKVIYFEDCGEGSVYALTGKINNGSVENLEVKEYPIFYKSTGGNQDFHKLGKICFKTKEDSQVFMFDNDELDFVRYFEIDKSGVWRYEEKPALMLKNGHKVALGGNEFAGKYRIDQSNLYFEEIRTVSKYGKASSAKTYRKSDTLLAISWEESTIENAYNYFVSNNLSLAKGTVGQDITINGDKINLEWHYTKNEKYSNSGCRSRWDDRWKYFWKLDINVNGRSEKSFSGENYCCYSQCPPTLKLNIKPNLSSIEYILLENDGFKVLYRE